MLSMIWKVAAVLWFHDWVKLGFPGSPGMPG